MKVIVQIEDNIYLEEEGQLWCDYKGIIISNDSTWWPLKEKK